MDAPTIPAVLPLLFSASFAFAPLAQAQPADSFDPLFQGDPYQEWVVVNADDGTFSLDNGVLTVRGSQGWLRSPRQYADFILRTEFRFLEADADTGIFVRAGLETPFIRGWPGNSYQIQTREISANPSDSPLPLGNVYRHSVAEGETSYARDRVFELYTGVGEWQEFEITVVGGQIEVRLNGEEITVAENVVKARGYIGFQSETGTIEFRNMVLNEF